MKLLILLVVLVIAAPAGAEPTMAVWVDNDGVLTNNHDVLIGTLFEVVVTLDSDGSQAHGAAFDPSDVYLGPGVFVLGSVTPHGGCPSIIPEDCMGQDYSLGFTSCVEPDDRIQLVRINLGAFQGTGPADWVVTVRPYFVAAEPEFVDCSGELFEAPMGGVPGGMTSSGVIWPDGSLILNPTRPIPVGSPGVTALKTRY